jgi:hypothetical protein
VLRKEQNGGKMKSEIGDKGFPIWLLGDSNPRNWQEDLESPLDPRHPARHNIWTSVLDVIQDRVYRERRLRVDTSALYIRNAIGDPSNKPPENISYWDPLIEQGVVEFRQSLDQSCPILVFCFGAFSFEFMRRSFRVEPAHPYHVWGASRLGNEFRKRMDRFDVHAINAIPLLHTSISRGKFLQSHEYFTRQDGGNYFEYVGNRIADKLLEHCDQLKIWIE